jgi:hypothetical protein
MAWVPLVLNMGPVRASTAQMVKLNPAITVHRTPDGPKTP